MTMTTLILQVVTNGFVVGLIYALTAAGFSLIYGHAKILFFTIGEIHMLGAMMVYYLAVVVHIPYVAALAIVVLVLGLLGVLLERFLFRTLRGNDLVVAFSFLALALLIAGVALEVFGERSKAVPTLFTGQIKLLGAIIALDKLFIGVLALVILIGFHFFFRWTKTGRGIRAVSQDAEAAFLMGIDVNRTNALTFFLALGVAGAGGGLVAPLYYVDVFMGNSVLMTTFIVVVLGGLGSFPGAIVGGLFIGMLESFGYTFLGGITTLLCFVAVIILLIFRPEGFLGQKT